MPDVSEHATILRTFIADETAAFEQKRQGKYWPKHHYQITDAAKQAEKLLDAHERQHFYFYYMRCSGDVPPVSDKELPVLVAAYREWLAKEGQGHFLNMAKPLMLLFAFGFDRAGSLPSGVLASSRELKKRLKLVMQTGKYSHLPGMRAKYRNFQPFANEAPRILESLRHVGYNHDRRYPGKVGDTDYYDYTNLGFWGLVLTALLSPVTRTELLRDFVNGGYELPKKDRQHEILSKFVQAIMPEVSQAETEFRALAAAMAGIEHERMRNTEPALLARTLGLPFDDGEVWDISVRIPWRGHDNSPWLRPNLALNLAPRPWNEWALHVHSPDGKAFTEQFERVSSDEIGLGGLGIGNLASFPHWLKQRMESGLLDLDLSRMEVASGKKRAAGKLIAQWIRAG